MSETTQKELTFGEKLCSVNFNPSENADVKKLKALFAEAADIVYQQRGKNSEIKELIYNEALGNILVTQMTTVRLIFAE